MQALAPGVLAGHPDRAEQDLPQVTSPAPALRQRQGGQRVHLVQGAEDLIGQQRQRAVAHRGLHEPLPPGRVRALAVGRDLIAAERAAQPGPHGGFDGRVGILQAALPDQGRVRVAAPQRQGPGQQFDGERHDVAVRRLAGPGECLNGLVQVTHALGDGIRWIWSPGRPGPVGRIRQSFGGLIRRMRLGGRAGRLRPFGAHAGMLKGNAVSRQPVRPPASASGVVRKAPGGGSCAGRGRGIRRRRRAPRGRRRKGAYAEPA